MPRKSIRGSRRWRTVTVPRILRRDGGICHICGKPGADTADHLIAVINGGTDDDDNLAAAHHIPCNVRRGARPIETSPLTDAMLSELRSIRTRLGLISFQLGIAVVALGAIAGLLLGSVR